MKGRGLRALALFLLHLFVSAGPAAMVSGGTLPNTTQWSETEIGGAWDGAVKLQWGPDGRMYVVERGGRVWIIEPNGTRLSQPFIDISDEVGGWRDYGLLGFVLHPNFQSNGYVYLLYVVDHYALFNLGQPGYNAGSNEFVGFPTIGRITRYTADPAAGRTRVIPGSRKVLVGESPSTGFPIMHDSHGVGALAWGMDGTLLGVSGDGGCYNHTDQGSDSDTNYSRALSDGIIGSDQNIGGLRSQYLGSLSGKMVRIDPDTGDGLPSNPFYDPDNPRSARSRVWALGLRNPYRFTRKPGTGSHNPTDGNPGTFYVGDVGWNNAEDFHVVSQGGQNLGWPLFEGYIARYNGNVYNRQAKNPLYNGGSCTREYFYFSDLVKQESQNPISFPNPCDASLEIPDSWTDGSGTTWRISKFEHSRPALSWRSNAQAPTFDASGNATTCQVGASGCVAGPQFSGNSSTGGVWYTGTDFPASFQDSYFHADWGGQWIKALKMDANDRVTQVTNFLSGEPIVFVGTHPTQGGLYYVSWGEGSGGRVRRIAYTASGNQPPRAAAAPAVSFGPSPLAVSFSSAGSIDPEGLALQYSWDFGDGTPSSTAANPTHTFTAPSANPARFDVRLRVTDSASNVAEKFVLVSPNNTPPAVDILSPPAGTLYPMDRDQPYTLAAEIVDLEHAESQLTCQWQLALHHNEHNHAEPVVNACSTTLVTSPAGCDGNTYFYRGSLTVTDPMGLATTRAIDLYPDCPNTQPDLAVAIADSPDPGAAGSPVTYALTVTNNGRGLAQGATLTDVLPAGFALVSVDPSGCSVAGQTVTCALGDLSPASSRTFTVIATATSSGVFTNVATVSTPTLEANLTNNQGTAMTAVAPTASEPPVAENLSLVTNEDTPVGVTLAASDPEGQPLTFSVLTQPTKGVLGGTAPNLTYAPSLDANGPDAFTYVATDSGGRSSAAATVSLQVNALNDPPVAGSQSVAAGQNASIAVTLTATDVDGGPLTFTVVTPPAHGTLTGMAPALTYTPAAGYAGPDAFTFKANDGAADSALATVSITVVSAPGTNWWDLRWTARRRLVMNAAARTTALVDFPLLVRLDASRIDYTLTQTGGRDLRFVDADGVTVLPHDVESWTPGGTSYVWVKVPRIDAGSTTDHVWMYYGNPAATDGQNRAGLWGASYRGVWHLQDASDASGNGRNGSDSGSTAATGRIGGARRFDGVSNHIAVPHTAALTFAATASYSLSAWVQLSALQSRWMGVVGKADAGATGWYGMWLSDARRWVAGGGTALNGSTAVTGWTHVAVVQDGPANSRRLYLNGAQAASGTAGAATGTASFWIGGAPGDTEFLNGVVDEVRLAGLARSADWLAAEVQSESDAFLTFVSDPTAPNLAPTANALSSNTSEDTPVSVTLAGSDPEGQPLTYAVVTQPQHGTLAGGGSAPLPAQACDATGGGAPSGGCESKRTVEGSSPFTITKPSGVARGQTLVATCSSEASITPGALTGGAPWISIGTELVVGLGSGHSWGEIPWRVWYKVAGDAEPANYTLTLGGGTTLGSCLIVAFSGLAESAPYEGNIVETTGSSGTGSCGSITTSGPNSLAYCVCGILEDDTATSPGSYTEAVDFEGSSAHLRVYPSAGATGAQPVSFSAADPWACRHLSFRRNPALLGAGPDLVYTPAANYNGADSFTFKVTDPGGAASAPATAAIAVAPVNDPPAASPLTASTPAQTGVAVTLAGSDPDGDTLAFATVTAPAHGTLLGIEPSLTYMPAAGYTGPDLFTFRVSDPSGATATATASITVTPVNAPPVALASAATTNEDTSVPVPLAGSDPDGGALTFTITTPPAHGSLSGTAPALTYTPAANYFGPDTFAFSVRDPLGATSAQASVSITVLAVNDPPLASFTATPSSGAPPLLVTANAAATVDPDGVIASYAWNFGDGATASGPTASHTYTVAGTYTLTLTVVDDAGASAVATRSVAALSTPWWNASWTQRRKLTFDNAARASNLTNFPVLVSLDPSRIDYANTRSGGADLRFVDANGSTVLAYEIEQWNAGGTSTVWVRVPQIDGASSADHIWMYYGNPSASSGQNRNTVWSASFGAVWHLTSTSTDSTGKNHSGTNLGAVAASGRLGGAQRFNGTSARIRVSNATDLRFAATASFTVTAWVQLDALPSAVKSVVTKSQNQAPRYGLGIDGANRWVARGTTDVVGSTAATQWAHLALVQDGAAGQRRLYVNGTLASTGATQAANGSGQLYIGGSSSASDYLAGIIDEVRIAAAARSADWIAAEAASESGALTTFSAQ